MPVISVAPKAIGYFEPTSTSKHQRDWLLVELEASGEKIALPVLTRVKHLGVVNGAGGAKRDRFEIVDFEYAGKIALSTHAATGSRLIDRPNYTGPVLVAWNMARGRVKVSVPSSPTIPAIDVTAISDNKVPDGKYFLRPKLPMDRRQPDGTFPCERYQSKAAHACHWWLIEWQPHEGYSFHCGSGTLGCVTVTDHAKWEDIYKILAAARTADGKYTGEIIISGHGPAIA